MDKPLVSIIIPVYNVERYIDKCLHSVIAQTYRPLEVIVVDDCGNDSSIEKAGIMLSAHSGDNGFSSAIFHHDHNRGLSAGRNTGTDAAKGKYVYYLDSDDYISSHCIEKLVAKAEKYQAELTVGGYEKIGDVTASFDTLNVGDVDHIEGNETVVNYYCQRKFYVMAWNKLVRLDFIRKHNLRFIEGLLHEDSPWSLQMAYRLNSVAFVSEPTYKYVIRPGSISTAVKLQKKLDSWTEILRCYIREINSHPNYMNNPNVHDFYSCEILNYYRFVVEKFPYAKAIEYVGKIKGFYYPSQLSSIAANVPVTHRLLNMCYRLPSMLSYLFFKLLSKR